MTKNQKIAFYDSGVGLLSVLLETKKALPKENFVIFADQANNPYGEKSQEQIKKFAYRSTKFLIDKHNIKMMVLACNTATVLALDHLRSNFKIPIIGVVPAVKPAAQKSKNGKIAIMSTPATAKSTYLKKLIAAHAKNAKTLRLGCAGLEEAIEVLDRKKINNLLGNYASSVNKFGADTLVLGCTHYPLVKNQLQKYLKKDIEIIDSGQAIARRIKDVLTELGLTSMVREKNLYYTTGDPQTFSRVSSYFLKSKVSAQKAPFSPDD